MEPVASWIVLHPIGEACLVLAPYAALLLTAVPVARIRLGRRPGRLSGSLQVDAPLLNVAVGLFRSAPAHESQLAGRRAQHGGRMVSTCASR